MTHPRAAQTTSSRLRRLAPFLLLSLLSPGCGGGGGEPPPPVVHQSQAPSCADLVGDGDPRLLFSHRLIDPEAVSAAVVLGDMDPSSPQETLNFEQGMYVPVNTPLSAPTDIYVEAIVRSTCDSQAVGVFNVAGRGTIPVRRALDLVPGRKLPLPSSLVMSLLRAGSLVMRTLWMIWCPVIAVLTLYDWLI